MCENFTNQLNEVPLKHFSFFFFFFRKSSLQSSLTNHSPGFLKVYPSFSLDMAAFSIIFSPCT